MTNPSSPFDDKARHLRAMYRKVGEAGRDKVQDEYRRLFGEDRPREELSQILVNAWIEGRELSGQRYDVTMQQWIGADGEVVRD